MTFTRKQQDIRILTTSHLGLTSINDNLGLVVAGETNARIGRARDVLLEPSDLKGGKDGGVVAGHDVHGTAVRGVDNAGTRVGPPQDTVTVRGNVDSNLSGQR